LILRTDFSWRWRANMRGVLHATRAAMLTRPAPLAFPAKISGAFQTLVTSVEDATSSTIEPTCGNDAIPKYEAIAVAHLPRSGAKAPRGHFSEKLAQ
jgi:hypothetical protein